MATVESRHSEQRKQLLVGGAPELRPSSERVERLHAIVRERMTAVQSVWGANLTVLNDPDIARLPLVLRRAKAFEKTLLEMPIGLEDDDLIVGNTIEDGVIVRTRLPRFANEQEYAQARDEGASISAHLGHKTPYYYAIMNKGLSGIITDIDNKISEITDRPTSEERDEKLDLFLAMKLECNAIIGLAHRYAELVTGHANEESNSIKRNELLRIADVCKRVPEFPAQTFHESVQAFWFIHYAFFSTGTNISCGRFDQFLYPTLRKQLEDQAVSLEHAQELIDCVWLRFNDRAQIVRENFFAEDNGQQNTSSEESNKSGKVIDSGPQSWAAGHRQRQRFAADAADAINHFGQNILLSGVRPDGTDGTNELTYICLNSLEKFAFTSPVVTVRLHAESPHEVMVRSAEVLKSGGGMPYINNDDIIVQAYVDLGVSLEDARDYANSNCWETMIEGKSDQELIRGMNFLLFLELALNRGESSVHGRIGLDTGDARQFTSFDQVMAAWKAQIDHQLKEGIRYIGDGVESGDLEHSNHGKYSFNPGLSALTLDCIQNERDVIRGGARYIIWHVMGEAVANAIDSMSAIKKMVFDNKQVSVDELLDALSGNWEGNETIRGRLMARAPKFANDDDYADDIGREMMGYFIERSRFYASQYPNVIFPCSVGTFSWYAMIGKEVAATPDGRYYGEAIAANFSPAPGADMSGPTSAINSYLKMRVTDMAAGAPLDLRLAASGLTGEPGTQRLTGLIQAFIGMGGNMLTFTVTDVEELKKAMEAPENYRHLRVRMGGWSAYFVMLGKEQQLLHIRRVEHGLV